MDCLVLTFSDLLALLSHFCHTSICPRPRPRPRPRLNIGVNLVSLLRTSEVGAVASPPQPHGVGRHDLTRLGRPRRRRAWWWEVGEVGWGSRGRGGQGQGGERGWGEEGGGEGGRGRRCSAALTPVRKALSSTCRGGGPPERRAGSQPVASRGRGEESKSMSRTRGAAARVENEGRSCACQGRGEERHPHTNA